ncbi:MAG: AraC family transcriptional regulator [Treponema sp.]|jgi:AraC-like DNA-binding protein|nr:AraC family transcriptional regulator [Treponema sp.]
MASGRKNPVIPNNYPPVNYPSFIIRQPVLLETGVLTGEEKYAASSHVHSDSTELVFAVKGNGFVRADEKVFPFNAGDLFIVNPGVSHYEDFSDSAESCVLYHCQFTNLQVCGLSAGHILPGGIPEVINTGCRNGYFISLFKILFEESCNQSFGYERILYSRLETLILNLYRLYKPSLPRDFSACTPGIAVAAKVFIDQHFHADIDINDICAALYVGNSRLYHEFSGYYHLSPVQYLKNRRINEAMRMLLNSNLLVKEIANIAGFRNLSNFNAHFRQYAGFSPVQYRNFHKSKVKELGNPLHRAKTD